MIPLKDELAAALTCWSLSYCRRGAPLQLYTVPPERPEGSSEEVANMGRGTGSFNGAALRAARQSQGLSAAQLATQVGTSKAMILAYEAGRTVPEARRVRVLAQVLSLDPRDLILTRLAEGTGGGRPGGDRNADFEAYAESLGISKDLLRTIHTAPPVIGTPLPAPYPPRIVGIADMRRASGMRISDVAERAGISISSYRAIESRAQLPTRGSGRFPGRLAQVLQVPFTEIENALRTHYAYVDRVLQVAEYIRVSFDKAKKSSDYWAVATDREVIAVSEILRQPESITARAFNYELTQYRNMLRRHAEATARLTYPLLEDEPSTRIRERWTMRTTSHNIEAAHERAASRLTWLISQSLTSRQWRDFTSFMWMFFAARRQQFANQAVPVEEAGDELAPALLYKYPPPYGGMGVEKLVADGRLLSVYEYEFSFHSILYPRIYAVSPSYYRRYRSRV
jgi:transcriptional regulator with XRE-family HTH domain